jgi:hypothetical protein
MTLTDTFANVYAKQLMFTTTNRSSHQSLWHSLPSKFSLLNKIVELVYIATLTIYVKSLQNIYKLYIELVQLSHLRIFFVCENMKWSYYYIYFVTKIVSHTKK